VTVQLGFVIDLHRCIGCDTCMVACKMEHSTPEDVTRLKVPEIPCGEIPGAGGARLPAWVPTMCHHCSEAPCVDVCPTRALWRNEEDGAVELAIDRCVGCQRCGDACPYDAIWFDPVSGLADKCDLCENRRERGERPMCELVCPTRAIHFGDLKDDKSTPGRLLGERENRRLNEACGAESNIFYLAP
jgi:Fe-S-cluster-containing dehydrogenase component